jgi:hypothetical protein
MTKTDSVRRWRMRNKTDYKDQVHRYRFGLKIKVFIHYGGNPPKCACCGEENILFLTIDHINNNGSFHRKIVKKKAGFTFYRWLIKNGFPEGYQVLCWNCNLGKYFNHGVCPHERGKGLLIEKR